MLQSLLEKLNLFFFICQIANRKETIRNVTIRQQTGLEEPIIKETEQNQLTWFGHVQRMAEGRLTKIALKWMPKQKRGRGGSKKTGWKV